MWWIKKMPKFEKPIRIHFIWVSTKDDRRDPDNIASGGTKAILDAMQQAGKLKNDNRKYIVSLYNDFEIGKDYAVIMEIEEMKTFELKENTKDDKRMRQMYGK